MNQRQRLAQRLVLSLSPKQREELVLLQTRLAKVMARLWDGYAELLDVRRALVAAAGPDRPPVPVERFQPGDTLRVGDSFAQTDPRLVLVEHLKQEMLADFLGELAPAVLEAPELARIELLALLQELDEELLDRIRGAVETDDSDTDEFPISRPGCPT